MATVHRSSTSNRGDERFRALFEHASVGVALCDLDGRFCDVNDTLRDLLDGTGIDPDHDGLTELLHHTPGEADEVTEWCEGLAAVRDGRRLVARVQLSLSPPDAPPRLVQATAASIVLGDRAYLLAHIEDATGRRLEHRRLVHLATHDGLTGLPNRELVQQRLVAALARAASIRLPVGVLYLDLDHLEVINDRYGRLAGDAVLAEVGRRLASVLRAGDSAGRLGEDEFLIVAGDVPDESALAELVRRLEATVSRPVEVQCEDPALVAAGARDPEAQVIEVAVGIGVSIGAVLSRSGDQPASLMRRADAAMYAVKRARRRQARRVAAGTAAGAASPIAGPPRPRAEALSLGELRGSPEQARLAEQR
ncbi:MAG: diguanylate cyclase [Kineosporiaceae bacterium]